MGHPLRMPRDTRRSRAATRHRSSTPGAGFGPSRVSLVFGGVVVLAGALLAVAYIVGPLADAWHPVVRVDGQTANRSDLRARMAIDAALVDARRTTLRALQGAARITSADYDRMTAAIDADAADPLRSAVDGLTDDLVIRAEAQARGLAPAADVPGELGRAASADAVLRVRAVLIAQSTTDVGPPSNGWPAPAPNSGSADTLAGARSAAATRARDALAAGTSEADVAAALTAAGWRARAVDEWIGPAGPVDGLPDGLVAALRATVIGTVVVDDGTTDTDATAGAGRVVDSQTTSPASVSTTGIDGGALAAWAAARADERALRAALLDAWRQRPTPLVRVAELVIGPSDVPGVAGEYRSFAHLVVGQLPPGEHGPGTDDEAAARLATELRTLSLPDRANRFDALVTAADAVPHDALRTSGETPFFTRDQMLPALGDLAFAPGSAAGDILGPVATTAGTELFFLRATFTGTLDDRSNAALVEARSTVDFLASARRLAPVGEWPRADGTLWRAQDEGGGDPGSLAAYATVPVGSLSSPFVLDREIVVAELLERKDAPAPATVVARLEVRGFEGWLAGRVRAAAVVRDPEPLPGISLETASPEASGGAESGGAIPTPHVPAVSPVP